MSGFLKRCGFALLLGGLLLALINLVLTPLMPSGEDEAATRLSAIYLVRLSASGLAALFLLFGCIGAHLAQRHAAGRFGAFAFGVVFVGNALVVAIEWSNVFVLRAVAETLPEALAALDASTLMTIGFAASAGLFGLGWLLLAISMLRSGVFARWTAVAIIAGFVAIPALAATPLGLAGAIAGNVILGLGIAGLGRDLIRLPADGS